MSTPSPSERGAGPAARPIIAVLQEDPQTLVELLARRFDREYDVAVFTAPEDFAAAVQRWNAGGRRLALVLADRTVSGRSCISTLAGLRALDEHVIRCLMVPVDSHTAAKETLAALAIGDVDRYIGVPWAEPNVGLYPVVTELLGEWWRVTSPATAGPIVVRVVAPYMAPRASELRDLLDRNRVTAEFIDPNSATAEKLRSAATRAAGVDDVVVAPPYGRVLTNPTNREIAEALGAYTRPTSQTCDVAIVGAGPAGLAAAVYASSEGLHTVVVEAAAIGGQAGTSSAIRNYPGFPYGLSGTDLAGRASQQAWLFGTDFVLINSVEALDTSGAEHRLRLADGSDLSAKAVILALGVDYRRLAVPGLERLVGAGVFYGAARAEAPGLADRRVFIVGAGNSAGQAAVYLARYAERVTLVVRGDSLSASMSDYLVRELARTANVTVLLRTEVVAAEGDPHLQRLTLRSGRDESRVAADGLFIMIGAEPKTQWLPADILRDDHGFVLTGEDITPSPAGRPLLAYETSVPGVFAVGDVRRGSVKRVASAVGEGAVCVSSVHRYLDARSTAARNGGGG